MSGQGPKPAFGPGIGIGIFLQPAGWSILPRMNPPDFLVFTPVPLRARCDGWDPSLQLRFIQALARGAKPGEAAASLGKNRQNAYALRRRAGAQSFAAAWDAAAEHGRAARAARAAAHRPRARRTRAMVPHGPRAEAIAALGHHQIAAAASPAEARAALTRMLDGLYGRGKTKNDKSDNFSPHPFSPGEPKISQSTRPSVAFRGRALRRPPC